MNKFLTTSIVLCIAATAFGQYITKNEVDSLRKTISKGEIEISVINSMTRLAIFYTLKQGASKTDLDSAAQLINNAISLNRKKELRANDARIALAESYYYRVSGHAEQGKKSIGRALAIAKAEADKSLLGEVYFEMSNYYNYDFTSKTINLRLKLIEMAMPYFQESSNVEQLAYCYKMIADLHHLINEYQMAFDEVKLSIKLYKSINYPELQGPYTLISKLYYAQGDYKQSLSFGLAALKIAEFNGDTTMQLCEIDNNLGYTFYKLNDIDNALKYFTKSIEIAERAKDSRTVYMLASNIVETYIKSGKPSAGLLFIEGINRHYAKPKNKIYEAGDFAINKAYLKLYMALKQYDKAWYYCAQLISESKNPAINVYILSSYYSIISQYYIATRNYTAALPYLNKNNILLSKLKDFVGLANNYDLWFTLDTAENNYRSAVENLLMEKHINDSVFNETKIRELKQLEVQYETEKKENQMKLKDQHISFLIQKNQLQQSKLQQANLLRNVTIGGIFALFAIIFLLLRQYVQRQQSSLIVKQSNTLITQKNELLQHLLKEKEWLLKEVHHRVKNNLHTVICLLESQAAYLEDDALKAIENSQHRIYAMSLIHQKLYQSDDVKAIDMSLYLPEFIQYLSDSFDTQRSIRFQLDVQPLMLGVSQAIPLALIINEAVTNAIKYAFAVGENGIIEITMHQMGDQIMLLIADNGIGIDPIIASMPSDSLGLKLMRGLSEDINADITFENDKGTRITIIFNVDQLNNPNNLLAPAIENGAYG